MRRTLTVLVASAALLVPASAASAASTSNASCNSGKSPAPAGGTWNGHGADKHNVCGASKSDDPFDSGSDAT
jgi:Spy/CpxP family protein refolding chaperone